MKFMRTSILVFALLLSGMGLYAQSNNNNNSSGLTGLNSNLIIDFKPKTCDFQWWKGAKNYNTTGQTPTQDNNTTPQ